MPHLEDLSVGAVVRGVRPECPVTVVAVKWHGTGAIELTYKDPQGKVAAEILFRDRESSLEIVTAGPVWNFDADGDLFRLVSEAYRIRLAYLFDPLLAVHTALVEPLPHQILAVYRDMIPRQPLRFLLADDPGAGKTIMAGLFIKELIARGDLRRCLIICPGALVEQWQDELSEKFLLPFEILTSEGLETAHTNWFKGHDLVIARLDKLSRDEAAQAKLGQTDWDLVVVDEAHKMSASFFGGEVKETKRYKLGRLVGSLTRHLLLMTATPHNGKEEDFQLFMALLDADRFEGRFRDGVHVVDPSDLMRRLVKEQILKFDGTPLFPERRAYTAGYRLSDGEAGLYKAVTDYVREEFNRADALEEGRRGTVGFALTILQRRLASSPEAIYQSLRRRKERLEKRLREEELLRRGGETAINGSVVSPPLDMDSQEDLDDLPEGEREETEENIVDQATASRTIAELKAEIFTLTRLEALAHKVRHSETDRKWEELSHLLQNEGEMFDAAGHRRKLVIFTEHRDTLNYLKDRIRGLIGKPDAVTIIHGSLGRDERRKAQERFTQDKTVEILVATDAAGEGINLQRAHLMVNYDLPWNPNRLEQRFGRIHRIGQTEVCHLWNLLAEETREGDVFKLLFEKLEKERKALGNGVFDILGKLFRDTPLRELLIKAIRYGDDPAVRENLKKTVDNLADQEHCRELLEERALARDSMDIAQVRHIREEMERAEARRLQPHFIASFFLDAFKRLGGRIHQREPRRYEITHVPLSIRERDRQIGRGIPVLERYERITFEKDLRNAAGLPMAEFVCPGHPLLDATLDIVLERHRSLFKQGAILVDPSDPGDQPSLLFYLQHSITDARTTPSGEARNISQQLHFVRLGRDASVRSAGYAPYLDYRPLKDDEKGALAPTLSDAWLKSGFEEAVMGHAISEIVPRHLESVKTWRLDVIGRTATAVKERLSKEIAYWDHRAEELKAQELAGKTPRLNSAKARQRADELQERLTRRLHELDAERHISPLPPVVVGGALVIPQGLLSKLSGQVVDTADALERAKVEAIAMAAVIEAEKTLGHDPHDVSKENLGYDVESRIKGNGRLRFIEVKGRRSDATTVTVTRNEILCGLNKPDDYILAVVRVSEAAATSIHYLTRPFQKDPDFGVESVNYGLKDLLTKAAAPG